MSRLYMKQQVFSLVDKFTVKNEYEEDCYRVHSDFITLGGKKLHIEDASGNEVAMVLAVVLAIDCVQADQDSSTMMAGMP